MRSAWARRVTGAQPTGSLENASVVRGVRALVVVTLCVLAVPLVPVAILWRLAMEEADVLMEWVVMGRRPR